MLKFFLIYIIDKEKEASTMAKKKKKKNYINNKDLLAEVIKSKEAGKMTDEFGKMMLVLVKRYSSQGCYSGYTYVDDMESYALMTVCKVWNSFKPEKSDNPFAYFTQTIKRAFWQYLNQESRHRDIRDEMLMQEGELPSHTYVDKYAENLFNSEFESSLTDKNVNKALDSMLDRLILQLVGNRNHIKDKVKKVVQKEMLEYEIEKNSTPYKTVYEQIGIVYSDLDPEVKNITVNAYESDIESYDEFYDDDSENGYDE